MASRIANHEEEISNLHLFKVELDRLRSMDVELDNFRTNMSELSYSTREGCIYYSP